MLDLYKNIKLRRKALGMTQTELASKTGYTNKSSIASIESGKVDLPQSKILDFAKALSTTPTELMGWDDEPITMDFSKPGKTNSISEDNEYIQMYAELKQEDKDMVNRLIKVLYETRGEK